MPHLRTAAAVVLGVLVAPPGLAQNCTSNHTEPSGVIGGVAAGGVLAGLVALSVFSRPSGYRGGTNADCGRDEDCMSGYYCAPERNQCVRRDDGAVTQKTEAVRLFLRARVIELREELALGRGGVIDGLARAQQVPPAVLGRFLRQHRAELLAEIGDGKDPAWAARFLSHLDGLMVSSQPT